MNIVCIIPARMASTRFPNKPMAKILGRPMIEHCYRRASMALGIHNTYVATCDWEISKHIQEIGGAIIMTDKFHARATTRTAEALSLIEKELNKKIDIVVMVQGDEPLINPEDISQLLLQFKDDAVSVANLMTVIETDSEFFNKNNVKVVVNKNMDALYFSREAIPSGWLESYNSLKYMQTGVIAFRRSALFDFNLSPETYLEKCESVDMNRLLEIGASIRMVLTNSVMIGVDTKEDLFRAEQIMNADSLAKKY